jgi:hypothetical protein
LARLEVVAEAQAEIVIAGLVRGLLEQPAILRQAELVERAVQQPDIDPHLAEDAIDVAAHRVDQGNDAVGGRGQDLRSLALRMRGGNRRIHRPSSPIAPRAASASMLWGCDLGG